MFEIYRKDFENPYLKKLVFFLVIIFLIIISGIRYQVGTDFISYLNIFNRIDSISSNAAYGYLEYGFRLMIVFFKSLNFPPLFLFFVFSVISYIFLGAGILKSSKYPFVSLFTFIMIFMISYLFNVLRQGIAMSILIYLIPDIKEKNLIRVLLFSLIAVSMHSTGYLILLCFAVYHIPVNRRVYVLATLGSIIYYFNSEQFYRFVSSLLSSNLQDKMISYMERFPGGVDLTSFLLRLILVGIFIFYYDILKDKEGFKGIFNIYFAGFIFYILLSFQGQAATRVNMFFRILEVLLFPYLLTIKSNVMHKTVMFLFVLAIGTLVFGTDLTRSANFPFQFYWDF